MRIFTPSVATTLPLGHRHIILPASNQLLNNNIHQKQAVSWSAIHLRWGLSCKKSQCVQLVGYLRGRAPPWMFDRTLNAALPNNLLPTRRKSEEKLLTTDIVQGNLGLSLLPNSLDLHQNNKMKSCADPASSFP